MSVYAGEKATAVYNLTYDGSADPCYYKGRRVNCTNTADGWLVSINDGSPSDPSPWGLCKSCYNEHFYRFKSYRFTLWDFKLRITGAVR